MPFEFVDASGSHPTEVIEVRDDASVADLARALDPACAEGSSCACDGIRTAPHTSLRDWVVPRGATVTVVEPSRGAAPDGARSGATSSSGTRRWLQVVGGLDASHTVAVDGAPIRVGRAPNAQLRVADPTVSELHAEVRSRDDTVTVHDLDSTNGTWIGAEACVGAIPLPAGTRLRIGATVIEATVTPPPRAARLPHPLCDDPSRRPGTWTTPFNRPPRPPRPDPPDPVRVPTLGDSTPRVTRLGIAGLVAPIVVGGVMVLVMGNLLWGAFAALGPVLMLGSWWDQRRNGRRDQRGTHRRNADALLRFDEALDRAVAHEERRRRRSAPNPAVLRAVAEGPSPRLWERRPDHDDFGQLRIGIGDVDWTVPTSHAEDALDLDLAAADRRAPIDAAIQAHSVLRSVPIEVDCRAGAVLGVVGPPPVIAAVTRALVLRACIHHGPADLALIVHGIDAGTATAATATTEGGSGPGDWRWCRWLPHLVADATASDATVPPGGVDRADEPLRLVVIPDAAALTGHRAGARRLLADRVHTAAIVCSEHPDQLPATCTTVVDCTDAHGTAILYGPRVTHRVHRAHLEGLHVERAARTARALARLRDPEAPDAAGTEARAVRLIELCDLDDRDDPALAEEIAQRWASAEPAQATSWPLGIGADGGVVDVDLCVDGPHLLVAGTTGSGKSELLRSMLVGLATSAPPDQVSFVLVDFKGGSAFDDLASLPHTVGLVTDLSPTLAHRTIRCLEAELRRRERILRGVGASDVRDVADGPGRLVVVVDEFATLARDLPDVLDALVSIAQRGRSLGVHLVLATQRPAGTVSDAIRANVTARIALRLVSDAESTDVIDAPDAARISRRTPGRALVRLGAEALVGVRVATVGAIAPATDRPPVRCAPAWPPSNSSQASASSSASDPVEGPRDVDRVVAAVARAWASGDRPPPHPVCPPPLEERHTTAELDVLMREAAAPIGDSVTDPASSPSAPRSLPVAIGDAPDEQRRRPVAWHLEEGPLVVVGVAGSGTSTALDAIGRRLGHADPRTARLVVFDGADRRLASLDARAHTDATVPATDPDRQRRAIAGLHRLLRTRRAQPDANEPRIVVLVDDAAGLLARWEDPLDDVITQLGELFTTGSAHRIHLVLALDRAAALPLAWQAACTQRWTFRVADVAEMPAGHPEVADPGRSPGRFHSLADGLTAHVVVPEHADRSVGVRTPIGPAHAVDARRARVLHVGSFPDRVRPDELPEVRTPERDGDALQVAVGVAHGSLEPIGWSLATDEHALVIGPARSGKSTLLAGLAEALGRAPGVAVLTVSGRRTPRHPVWDAHLVPGSELVDRARCRAATVSQVVILADDADRLPEDGHGLEALVAEAPPWLHVIAALDAHAARGSYGHFTQALRRSRLGVALCPDVDLDGDLFGVRLPRRAPIGLRAGRGYVLGDGSVELAQLIEPTTPESTVDT